MIHAVVVVCVIENDICNYISEIKEAKKNKITKNKYNTSHTDRERDREKQSRIERQKVVLIFEHNQN